MRLAVHGGQVAVQQSGAIQFAQNGHDAAGAVHVFHVVGLDDWAQPCDRCGTLRDMRSMSFMVKSTPAFMRRRQQMQHGVGRAAHGDIQRHGVFEGLEGGDASAAARCMSSCS